ncbi:hypothetical protein MPTK1_5g09930 [Marchantia polymorpha subsp. ruderalis]|uniref:Uncharacterized protein n=2 Tax=Marchantia polymorpha TaxID=3197 RepID=A0AAF6BGR6_MARPO|nr:hypothetical protein MARPO_0048s0078 [Marchantia polymorpha]BBN11200.1 hypothetical protein Mp_5g09930 [Marchantia polymorpha subsp. ruderalis]|eukprot:PTQ38969.1 hypothetical protein MARPO_0048s0078 [Marchantia polymorpha]
MSKQLEPHGIKLGLRSDDWDIRRMHVVPTNLPVSHIPCREPWSKLSETQKHFVHHFARASWSGSRICARQISEESPDILRLLMLLLSSTEVSDLKRRCHVARVTPEEWDFFIAYAICFLTNMGNYLAFGDMKIVPGIPEHQLEVIVGVCPLQDERKRRLLDLWEKTRKRIYSLSPGETLMTTVPNHVTLRAGLKS